MDRVGGVSAQKQDLETRGDFGYLVVGLLPTLLWHDDIEYGESNLFPVGEVDLNRLSAVPGSQDFVSVRFQRLLKQVPDRVLVLRNEKCFGPSPGRLR